MKYFIFSPTNSITGGPENLHQIGHAINHFGGKAFITYFPDPHGGRSNRFFKNYGLEQRTPSDQLNEILILAEKIRANRDIELQFADHDIIPSFKRKADFVEYFQKVGESKGRSTLIWKNALVHLKKFSGGSVQFKNINELWLERF